MLCEIELKDYFMHLNWIRRAHSGSQETRRYCTLQYQKCISTDEDLGLRIESFAILNLRGVSTNKIAPKNSSFELF
jgi:hypothetical protein